MKKAKVRTRYMIPMRLWSVVVTHDVQPVGWRLTSWAVIWGSGLAVVEGALTVAAMDQGVVFSSALRWAAAATSAALMAALRLASQFSNCWGSGAAALGAQVGGVWA